MNEKDNKRKDELTKRQKEQNKIMKEVWNERLKNKKGINENISEAKVNRRTNE